MNIKSTDMAQAPSCNRKVLAPVSSLTPSLSQTAREIWNACVNFTVTGFFCFGMMLFGGAAQAHSIGTVFYSPAERVALVAARSGITQSVVYTLTGIIQRGAGKSAAWINGRAVTENPPDPVIPSLVIKRDHVLIEGKVIRVGETVNIVSGQRVLRLPEQAVRVKR